MGARTRPLRGWRRRIWTALCAGLLVTAHAQPVRAPEPGVLLVAGEQMTDPRFRQAVLLIIDHDATGTWGLVINKPTHVNVGEVLPDLETPAGTSKVYFGGPLRLDHLMFLYRSRDQEDADAASRGATGVPGVRWSDSEDMLAKRIAGYPEQVRIYAGYAGWAPGQLGFELAHGGWRMIQGRPENVFSEHPEQLWRHLTDILSGIAI